MYYKTTKEAKEHLPDIIEEIKNLDEIAHKSLETYKHMVSACIRETIDETYNGGGFTTQEAMSKAYNSFIFARNRKRYFEDLIENIKICEKNT